MATITTSEKNSIIEIVLSRPDVRNAFNPEMIEELTQCFTQLNVDKKPRLVVLRGEGKAFCAGADLTWMKAMVQFSVEENKNDSFKLHKMFEVMAQCPHPVLGVVHGAAFGGALGLMACCDQVLAEEQTQFCFSEVKLGLVPAVISEFVLAKCSEAQIAPLMMNGQVFHVSTALRLGLVHEIAKQAEMEIHKEKLIQNWLEAGPEAVKHAKKLIRDLRKLNQAEEIKLRTTQVIAERRVSSEGQEGLKSFLEKRTPSWRIFEND